MKILSPFKALVNHRAVFSLLFALALAAGVASRAGRAQEAAYRNPNLPIEARVAAVALDSGAIGEKIQVQAVESRQVLFATVTGRDACEIKL